MGKINQVIAASLAKVISGKKHRLMVNIWLQLARDYRLSYKSFKSHMMLESAQDYKLMHKDALQCVRKSLRYASKLP